MDTGCVHVNNAEAAWAAGPRGAEAAGPECGTPAVLGGGGGRTGHGHITAPPNHMPLLLPPGVLFF